MAANDPFVHLHLHTEYSTLDGAVRIPDLMKKAARQKMPAVAMTDHGNLYGAVDFFKNAQKAEIKPIFGCEMYLAPTSMHEKKKIPGRKISSHLTLLCKDEVGYHNLVRLVSKAHLEGMYYKPRIDKEQLAKYSEGIICLSGCMTGEINQFILADQPDQARESVQDFIDIYSKDNFYLEVHDHGLDQQHKCTEQLLQFGEDFGLKMVAANDVHFLNKQDHEAHDAMICIGTGKMLLDENRMRYSPEVYFKNSKEMRKLFKHIPGACDHTLEIADRCNFAMHLDSTSSEKYPQFDSPDPKQTRNEYFRELCNEGLVMRYGEERATTDPVLLERLEYEIGIMEKMGFVSYFLITWEFIKWARDHDIPVGPGRGSAAGSLVAYCLRITDLDPIRFGLIFERFLNPERISPPDVDVDFCQSRRAEVIEHVRQLYGERCVSHIITFGTLGAKSVVRDVGRVLGWSYGDGDRVAKMIPTELGITLAGARQKNPDLKTAIETEPATKQLWEYATFLEGLTRGTGIHAAGVVIGDCELDKHIPLTRGNEGEVVTQYAMKPLTDVGMLKMDFLGLKTLTVIKDAVDLIHAHTPDFCIDDIILEDKPTFDLLNAGQTVGVFQLESGGMIALCKQFGVDRIEDIIALIALYRPGPMDLIPDFIDRKKGKKKVKYEHPLLEEVSKETHGILIYQEQVQKAANVLAGYSLGDADLLRRAMGKKSESEMATQRKIFVAGAARVNNIPEKKANDIFDLLEKFAGYGFNKSHSAAYGLISYQTAFLKANYPVEFMAALLSNEINNTDKISIFVAECKQMGVEILPPDVNHSQLKFAPEAGDASRRQIRFGLAAVKNVGGAAMQIAITNREQDGPFTSLEDFAKRLDTKAVNKKILESLIRCGAFDFSKDERAHMIARIDQVTASAASAQKDRASGQVSLFGDMDVDFGAPPPELDAEGEVISVNPMSKDEMFTAEKELLGFYVTGHPLDAYAGAIAAGKFKDLGDLEQLKDGRKYEFAGSIATLDMRYTKKGGKPFAIMTLEDFTGQTEVMVWNETWLKCNEILAKGAVVSMKAKVETDSRSESKRLTAEKISLLEKIDLPPGMEGTTNGVRNGNGKALTLHLKPSNCTTEDLLFIRETAERHQGNTPLRLRILTARGIAVSLKTESKFDVDNSPQLRRELERWLN